VVTWAYLRKYSILCNKTVGQLKYKAEFVHVVNDELYHGFICYLHVSGTLF